MSANKATGSVPYNPKEETHHAHGRRFSKPCRSRRNVCFQRSGASRAKIIASHDLDLILDTCPRTVLLQQRQIVYDGPTAAILANQELLQAYGLELPLSLQRQK